MGSIYHHIVHAVGANQHLAYALVFFLAFSESFPFIGSIIPGTTIILAISALVPTGAIDIWWLLGSAILGAIVGDGFSYWLGYRYHEEILAMWPFRKYPQLIMVGRAQIEKHGGKSVFIARFTPAIRAVVPIVAGILRMDPWRFYLVNVGSAFAWAVSHIIPAVVAGASLALAGEVGGRLLALIVILIVVLWLIIIIVRRIVRQGLPLLANGLFRLWHWARNHDNWVSREILSALDPSHNELKGLLGLIGLLIVSGWTLVGILREVVTGDPLLRADQAVFNFMQAVRTVWGDRVMVILTELGDAVVTIAVVLAVTLWLAARQAWRAVAYWLGAFVFASIFVEIFKLVLRAPRPIQIYTGASTFAFPSGHAAIAATVYGFLTLLITRELAPRTRQVIAASTALLVILIAFSRLYLGANWSSDVIAGLAFALAWTAGLGIVYLNHVPQNIGARSLLIVASLAFVVVGTLHVVDSYDFDSKRYALQPPTERMAADLWWRDGWATQPERRIDLGGGLEEPITVQWVGSVVDLRSRLLARGWKEPPELGLVSVLAWLNPDADLVELPTLTRLHDGRPAHLILIYPEMTTRNGVRSRLILRLWRSNLRIEDRPHSTYRLWLGAVVEQRIAHLGTLVSFAVPMRDENAPRALLESALAPVKVVKRKGVADSSGWNGWVLLAHDTTVSLPTPETEH
jgi:membrane protein DedA with SNARE-associated domain/membrane-associated phospholipid phosphatase